MAVVSKTLQRLEWFGDQSHVVTWTGLLAGDTGEPLEMPSWADRSIQVNGTFAAAQVNIEGSNNSSSYATLNDLQGTAITFTTEKIEGVSEITRLIRPRVVGGDGTTSLTVTILIRKG